MKNLKLSEIPSFFNSFAPDQIYEVFLNMLGEIPKSTKFANIAIDKNVNHSPTSSEGR